MNDYIEPDVSVDFLLEKAQESGKLEYYRTVGGTTAFCFKGSAASHRRTIMVRVLNDGCTSYGKASAIAYKYGFLPALMEWLIEHRQWKEGAYFAQP